MPKADIEYAVRDKTNSPSKYVVTKLGDGEPLEQYVVSHSPDSCQCMAWISKRTRPCKHQRLVQRWINEGGPIKTYLSNEVTSG